MSSNASCGECPSGHSSVYDASPDSCEVSPRSDGSSSSFPNRMVRNRVGGDENRRSSASDYAGSSMVSSDEESADRQFEDTPRYDGREGSEVSIHFDADVEGNDDVVVEADDSLALELHEELNEESTEEDESADVEIPDSLLDDVSVNEDKPAKKTSQKLQWSARPSVPAYMIRATNKFKLEDVGQLTITTKGQAAKSAAAKRAEIVDKVKESKNKLREETQKTKMTAQQTRAAVVAAEKARVAAAKKAREEQAERVRREAAERRKQEVLEKQRMYTDFEEKKAALAKARQEAMRRSRQ